jgi:pimeloyl-ACP methyl ester carboxylesterase
MGVERRTLALLGMGLVLVVAGMGLGWWGHTAAGDVDRRTTTFETANGTTLQGTLYVPSSASASDPAPGVLAIHGYTGSRGTMAGIAAELSRRGYVVLAMDQPGHGTSDPPAFASGWGGPAGLRTLRSLDVVDTERVGLVGHSMGGFASMAAARSDPDGYDSLVLLGSTAGSLGSPESNRTFPRNLALVWGRFDEYAEPMWGVDVPADVPESDRLGATFGVDGRAESGRVYGNVSAGTARRVTLPPAIHQAEHTNGAAIADIVDWMDRTLGTPQPADGQVWQWAELGSVLNFLGAVLVLVGGVGATRASLDGSVERQPTGRSRSQYVLAAATAVVPALLLYPLLGIGTALPASTLFPQQLTNGVVLWGLGSLLVVGAVRWGLVRFGSLDALALGSRLRAFRDRETLRRSLLPAFGGLAALSLVVLVSDLLGSSAGIWLIGFRPLTPLRAVYAVAYSLPLLAVSLGLAVVLHRDLASEAGLPVRVGRNLLVACGGLLALLAVQYVPLLLGNGLPVPSLASGTVYATSITWRLAAVTVLSTLVHDRTGRLFPPALVVAAVLLGSFVGGGPIHVAP